MNRSACRTGPWTEVPMPFRLAGGAEVEGVSDGAWPGRGSVFGALGVELEVAPFEDARVGPVAAWWEAEAGDLVEKIGQETVEKKTSSVNPFGEENRRSA